MVGFFNTLARQQCFLPSENFDFRNPERRPYTVQLCHEGVYIEMQRERKYVITLKRKIMIRRDKEGKNAQSSLVSRITVPS